jgi:hypothetical protein
MEARSGDGGAIAVYDQVRRERYRWSWLRVMTIHATFTLIGAFCVFVVAGIIGVLR